MMVVFRSHEKHLPDIAYSNMFWGGGMVCMRPLHASGYATLLPGGFTPSIGDLYALQETR